MDRVMDSGEETDPGKKAGEVESLRSARQARRVIDVISAAKAKLEDDGKDFSTTPKLKSRDRQYLHKPRTLTVSMWILVIATALLALFVFTSPLHLGRYSGVRYWADIILGISYITLGVSVVAICVWIVARYSLLRK